MAITIVTNYTRNLDEPLSVFTVPGIISQGDESSHVFRITLTHGATAENMTGGTVYGYLLNSADQTVVISGTVAGNVASVTLTRACYAVAGNSQLVVRVTLQGVTQTILMASLRVQATQSETIIDDDDVIPSITELLSKIAACEQAAARAETFVGLAPYIDSTSKNWYVYNSVAGVYQDTGVSAKGAKGDQGEPGRDGTGAGTITGINVNGVSVATTGVANINSTAIVSGASGLASAGDVYTAIQNAVGDIETALAAL